MRNGERVKRPTPARVAPDRSWQRRTASNGHAEAGGTDDGGAPAPEHREASYEAINDAYRVIDDYLRQGQRMAERIWLPAGAENGPMNDFGRILERFMRSAGEMGTAWLEMMGQWSSPPTRRDGARGSAGPFSAGVAGAPPERAPSAGPRSAGGPAVAVQVQSTRACEVAVDLFGATEPEEVEVTPLVGADGSHPPIREVRFERGADGRRPVVRVRVAAEQPAGVYNGMLLDRATRRPRGTVSVSLA